ncbi:hypothetical protein J3A83DRAFT_4100166 [Scleroderma citrinum]
MLAPPDVAVQALLQMRAKENRHLEHGLGVQSTFVSEDIGTHAIFLESVKELLSRNGMKTPGWKRLVRVTEQGVNHFLPAASCDFATFIRCVTFHIWVVGVLNPDGPQDGILQSTDLSVEQVTNVFFGFSETGGTSVTPSHLHSTLKRWITCDEDAHCNPVDLIYPMCEKLWRLVAATVICAQRCPVSKNPLLDFCDNPTERQFRSSRSPDHGPSAADIINEVLRVHPPVQEISRPYGLPLWQTLLMERVQMADIKAVQEFDREGERIQEPQEFVPGRWQSELKPAIFAFGDGPLKCPAESWAPAFAVLITSKVMDRVNGVGHKLEQISHIGSTAQYCWEEWVIRKALAQ